MKGPELQEGRTGTQGYDGLRSTEGALGDGCNLLSVPPAGSKTFARFLTDQATAPETL